MILRASRIGHPDMNAFRNGVGAATTFSELERVIQPAIGPSGFMEFVRFDHGEVVYKGETAEAAGIMRLVVGNPLIMKQMDQHLADAGSQIQRVVRGRAGVPVFEGA
jgi:hypothetical protein